MYHRLSGIALLLICLLLLSAPASAQNAVSATLAAPNTKAFPRVEAYLDVRDAQGQFIHGLQARDVRVLEDDQPVPVADISELRPGLQVAIAINPGPTFAVRNSQGVSRYDFLVQALSQWAKSRQGSTVDDWSLVTGSGSEVSHVSDPMKWLSTLLAEQLDARSATPNLNALFRAVELAADNSPRPGMGRAVLLVTPPIEGQISLSLKNLIDRANQQSVHIFVWLVVPPGAPTTPATSQLKDMADQTGGQLFAVSGEENIPNPEDYLDALRSIYQITYQSRITKGGSHKLAVEIQKGSEKITTAEKSFDIDVRPPDPAFVSPALEIARKPPAATADGQPADEIPVEKYVPAKETLQVLVDFPDGRVRPLVRTALYVDGALVAENTKPPFDQFDWDLSKYATSGEHLLQVQAQDILGLTGTSMETMVQVNVERITPSAWDMLSRHMPIVAALFAMLAGALLMLALLLGGRIRPRIWGIPQRQRRSVEPVMQPVPTKNDAGSRRLTNWVNRLQWPQRRVAPQAYAFLTRALESGLLPANTPIPITAAEMTLGNDPNQATLVLDDPSVEPLHARLIRQDDGGFRLCDEGSVAGTWINYTPIPQEGVVLEHGDLIHIGQVSFRFTLRQPTRVRKPVITPLDPNQELRS